MSTNDLIKVFNSLVKSMKEESRDLNPVKISEDHLSMLIYLFGDDLANALQLIDSKRIHLLRSNSNRQVFKVLGHDGRTSYICFKHAYYCTCPAFKHKVITSNDAAMCKHLIATRIANAMGLVEIENISDQQMVDKLLGKSADVEIIP